MQWWSHMVQNVIFPSTFILKVGFPVSSEDSPLDPCISLPSPFQHNVLCSVKKDWKGKYK